MYRNRNKEGLFKLFKWPFLTSPNNKTNKMINYQNYLRPILPQNKDKTVLV